MASGGSRRDETWAALADAVGLARGHGPNVRTIGGMMAELLTHAYPAVGFIQRGTVDVDLAVTLELAATGDIHRHLLALGYTAVNANSYENGARKIDVLVPTLGSRFRPERAGGRMFDAVPGLSPILTKDPIMHQIDLLASARVALHIDVPTPTVEGAVILKAITTASRNKPEDIFDLYNLLSIKDRYTPAEIGPWRLGEPEPTGARLDAIRALNRLLTAKTLNGTPPISGPFAIRVSGPRAHDRGIIGLHRHSTPAPDPR